MKQLRLACCALSCWLGFIFLNKLFWLFQAAATCEPYGFYCAASFFWSFALAFIADIDLRTVRCQADYFVNRLPFSLTFETNERVVSLLLLALCSGFLSCFNCFSLCQFSLGPHRFHPPLMKLRFFMTCLRAIISWMPIQRI